MYITKESMNQIEINNCHDGIGCINAFELIISKEKKGTRFIHYTSLPVGSTIGIHNHSDTGDREELFIFTHGQGILIENGIEHEIKAGDICRYLPGDTHGVVNTSKSEELKMIVIGINL
jgi:quercetin dioxygenase-like cupin family protein